MFKKLIARLILVTFFFTSIGPLPDASAQTIIDLPAPGVMVKTSDLFEPLQLKGILVNVKNPLRFDFLVDKGDSGLYGQPLKDEIIRSTKYFLTCLAVPENDLWVNLSPYEKDRIVPGNFGFTLMGNDLLAQDYLLKQIMASLSYPENDLGKQFWQKVYRKSYELYGTTNIPINTFNKVWILPKSAQVYVQGNAAFVVNSQLDVMLEADYKALAHHDGGFSENAGAYAQIFREVILPELRQEINEGKNFAVVRQVYNAMILATWYKRHLKDSLLGRMYVGRNEVNGVDIADKNTKERIYQQYLRAYKKCVYNYIKEDYDPFTQQTVARKYASGGILIGLGEDLDLTSTGVNRTGSIYREVPNTKGMKVGTDVAMATIDLLATRGDGEMVSFTDPREYPDNHPFHLVHRQDGAMFSFSKLSLSTRKRLPLFAAMAAMAVAVPSAQGATFKSIDGGKKLQVTVQGNDTFGQILLDANNEAGAGYVGPSLWGKTGTVNMVKEHMQDKIDIKNLHDGQTFIILTKKGLNEAVSGAVSSGVLRPSAKPLASRSIPKSSATIPSPKPSTTIPSIKPSTTVPSAKPSITIPSAKPSAIIPSVKPSATIPSTKPTTIPSTKPSVTSVPTTPPGKIRADTSASTASSGSSKVSGGNPPPPPKNKDLEILLQYFNMHKLPLCIGLAVFGITLVGRVILVRRNNSRKRRRKNILEQKEPPKPVEFVVVSSPEPLSMKPKEIETDTDSDGDSDQAALAEPLPDQETSPAVEASRPTRWLDTAAWVGGMALARASLGPDPASLMVTAAALPFLTRGAMGIHIYFHEVLGHAVPYAIAHPEEKREDVFTPENLRAGLNFRQWMDVLLPWNIPQSEKDNPGFTPPTKGALDPWVSYAGFKVTTALGMMSTLGMVALSLNNHWLTPVLGPVGVSALAMMKASWTTDIKPQEGVDQDKYKCGNYGLFWIGSPEEGLYPEWAQEGLAGMTRRLIVRGGQSAGQVMIVDGRYLKDGQSELILSKVLKEKRGPKSDLPVTLQRKFVADIPGELKELKGSDDEVFGINGHKRYATQGPSVLPSAQPFASVPEMRMQWELVDGKLEPHLRKFFMVISHNGDNDAFFLIDRELTLDEIRDFFPRLFHMKKEVWIPPDKETGKPGYFDYLPLGDTPPIALQMAALCTWMNWKASVRITDVLVNHKTADEALKDILSEEKLDAVSNMYEEEFKENEASEEDSVSRPELKDPSKAIKDLWVTEEMVKKDPTLRSQYNKIERLKERFLKRMEQEMLTTSLAGETLREWPQDLETRKKFVNELVRRFFTADRFEATKEFKLLAAGAYGLVVRSSIQNNGVTIWAKAQGMTVGWNLRSRFFAFASDTSALHGTFGDRGKLDSLFILDPRGSGEVVDVGFSSGQFYLRVFSSLKNRDLSRKQILGSSYPLDKSNPYYQEPVKYENPDNPNDEDLEHQTEVIQERIDASKDPKSFHSQSVDALAQVMASDYIEMYIKANSKSYKSVGPVFIQTLKGIEIRCLSAGTCSERQKRFLRREIRGSALNSIVVNYVENRVDAKVSEIADRISTQMIDRLKSGDIQDEDYLDEIVSGYEKEIDEFVNAQIAEVTDNFFTQFRKWYQKWEEEKELYPHLKVENKTDLIITGYEKSLWLGENMRDVLKTLLPDMNIVAASSNKILKNPLLFGIHSRTMAFVNSLSGTTFPSLALAGLLNIMTIGRAFLFTSRMDAMAVKALGQGINTKSKFKKRVFLTGRYYSSESAPTSSVLLYTEQILVLIDLFKRMREIFPHHNPWGMAITDADIQRLEEMVPELVKASTRITGWNEKHKFVGDRVNQDLVEDGENKADRYLLETPRSNGIFKAFVYACFLYHGPIRAVLSLLGRDPGDGFHSWAGFVTSIADGTFANGFQSLLTTLVLRSFSKRPRWGRQGTVTMVIGDKPANHQILEQDVSKLGAMSLPSMAMNVQSGDPEDHFGAKFAHRIVRGTAAVLGLPIYKPSRDDVETTLKQAKSIRNSVIGKFFMGGAEITTIGVGEYVNPIATAKHISLGKPFISLEDGKVAKSKFSEADPNGAATLDELIEKGILKEVSSTEVCLNRDGGPISRPSEMQASNFDEIWGILQQSQDSELVQIIYDKTFDPVLRMSAMEVLFNAMYKKASTITVIPEIIKKIGPWEIHIKKITKIIWKRHLTYPSISVHSTRSPVGINRDIQMGLFKKFQKYFIDTYESLGIKHPHHDPTEDDESMVASSSKNLSAIPHDNALLIQGSSYGVSRKGGIDMNSGLMQLKITGETQNRIWQGNDNAMSASIIESVVPQVSKIVIVTPEMLKDMLGTGYLN